MNFYTILDRFDPIQHLNLIENAIIAMAVIMLLIGVVALMITLTDK